MYDMALWKNFSATVYRKLKSAYNKCIKKMFGYTRRDSMTSVFLLLTRYVPNVAKRSIWHQFNE